MPTSDEAPVKPTEAEVQALLDAAKATRKRPSRTMWIAALALSLICVGGLAYGLITHWDAEPDATAVKAAARTNGSGFGFGLLIGIGAGIVIGSFIAVRRRQP